MATRNWKRPSIFPTPRRRDSGIRPRRWHSTFPSQKPPQNEDPVAVDERRTAIIDIVEDGVFLSSLSGCLIEANSTCRNVLGYSREEVPLLRLPALLSGEDQLIVAKRIFSQTIDEGSASGRLIVRTKGGKEIPIKVRLSLIRHLGEPSEIAGIARIDSPRLDSEESAMLLEEYKRSAASFGHEMKNALCVIRLGFENLTSRWPFEGTDSSREELTGICKDQIDKAIEISRSFMKLFRKEQPEKQALNINNIIANCLFSIQHTKPQGISLSVTIDENLHEIVGNGKLIEVAFRNIVINALESMPSGGSLAISTANVMIGGTQPGIRIEITDTGSGIRRENIEEIFQPFYSEKGSKGTGLGLTIALKNVLEHRGSIDVQSTPGQGTTFYITLPA